MSQKKVPSLPQSNALRYLKQIFKVPVENCRDFEHALEVLADELEGLPAGFAPDTGPVLLLDRFNVRAAIWDLHKKSTLAQAILELCEDSVYLLLADESLQGKDSLMFCACGIADKATAKEDMIYHYDEWTRCSQTPPRIITGYTALDNDEVIFIIAMQLSSFVPI